jgi:type II secretory pathway pseudopilin PulG
MTQVRKHSSTAGFTLVELTLAMAFISLLLLGIALLTMQISVIYNKGLTTRAVNEAGQLISADVKRSLDSSKSIAVKYAENGGVPTGGRLCTDLTVYAWNYGKYLNDTNAFNQFQTGLGPAPNKPIRFVKFPSGGIDYCTAVHGVYPDVPVGANDVLTAGDVNLAVHAFSINKDSGGAYGEPVFGDTSGVQRIYQISIVIGTSEQSILESNVDGCKAPTNRIDDQYCSVNRFSFTARAGNVE